MEGYHIIIVGYRYSNKIYPVVGRLPYWEGWDSVTAITILWYTVGGLLIWEKMDILVNILPLPY